MRNSVVVVVLWAIVLGAALAGSACGGTEDSDLATVEIGALRVQAEVPRGDHFYRGLGGRDSLPDDRGMLFVFSRPGEHGFWMRGMLMPIDIIWISGEGRVVDVKTAQREPGVPDDELTIHRPDAPALYVLEVRAGLAAEQGVQVGDEAQIELP